MKAHSGCVCPSWLTPFVANPLRRWLPGSRQLAKRHIRPGMTVLDFACGPAPMLRDFLRNALPGGRTICVDLQEAMLRHVARKARRTQAEESVELRLCGSEDANLPQGVADFALAFWVPHMGSTLP